MNPELKCPACGLSEVEKTLPCDSRTLLVCAACGLYYFDKAIPRAQMHETLQHEYFNPTSEHRYSRLEQEFDARRRRSAARIASDIRKKLPDGGKLLDVGCATGVLFLSFEPNQKWDFYGVEPSRAAYEYAVEKTKGRTDIQLVNGYLEQTKYPDDYFDAVSLLEVIYYFPDLETTFKELRRILKPGAFLFVEIPVLKYLLVRYCGPISLFMSGHSCSLPGAYAYYFSDSAVRILLERHGFTIEEVKWMPGSSVSKNFWGFLQGVFEFISECIFKITSGRMNPGPRVLYAARLVKK